MNNLKYDVIVVGGGPSGVNAAIASAREGAKTLLVERFGYLGGMLTNAGTGPMMTFHAGNTQVVRGIAEEIITKMKESNLSTGHLKDSAGYASSVTPFDVEGMKIAMEELAQEAGVDLLYHTNFIGLEHDNGHINKIKLFAKGGEFTATAKVYVDASADADLAKEVGANVRYGREKDKLAQPMTMNAKVYNVDREKLRQFLHDNVEQTYAKSHEVIDISSRISICAPLESLHFAIKNNELSFNREVVLCFETNNLGEFIINMSRVAKRNATNPFELTKAEIEGRRQVRESVAYLRKYVPGFENCILAHTGPNIGIRESNKIDGIYILNEKDLVNNVMFDDAIAMGGYPIDLHSPEGKEETSHTFLKPGSWYSIPYRSLITHISDNLVVVGRCISATHEALAAVRVTPIAMAVGQAGGTAAAQSVLENVSVQKVDMQKLRNSLIKNNQFLEPYLDENNN